MKSFKYVVSLINSFVDIKNRRLWKRYAVVILLYVSYVPLYGQYTRDLPPLDVPVDDFYDHKQLVRGQLIDVNFNSTNPEGRSIWSVLIQGYERFRVCQNGTVALLGANPGYASLNFYHGFSKLIGAIHNKDANMNMISANAIKFWSHGNFGAGGTPHFQIQSNLITSYTAFNVDKGNVKVAVTSNTDNTTGWIGTETNNGLHIGTNNQSFFFIDNKQDVYIGMTKTQANLVKAELRDKYRLFVYKGVLSEDFAIAPKTTWADFVFNNNYKLRPLSEVEKFINTNKHLPDVPSTKEVSENGYSQHDMNKVLLQKIEELTLYILKQEKKIESLEAKIQD